MEVLSSGTNMIFDHYILWLKKEVQHCIKEDKKGITKYDGR